MAEVTISNSPVHSDTSLTAVYGESGSLWPACGWHTGTDFVPYGSTGTNPDIYPCFAGEVVEVSTTGSLGNMVCIRDAQNRYWRYCHMVAGSITVNVGQGVTTSSKIRKYGCYWKCYRNPPSFRMQHYASLELFYIFKSFNYFRNSKCTWNCRTL